MKWTFSRLNKFKFLKITNQEDEITKHDINMQVI